ncbi:MAG: hypothetical protein EA340_13035, partial [Nitriliruptor sp.]
MLSWRSRCAARVNPASRAARSGPGSSPSKERNSLRRSRIRWSGVTGLLLALRATADLLVTGVGPGPTLAVLVGRTAGHLVRAGQLGSQRSRVLARRCSTESSTWVRTSAPAQAAVISAAARTGTPTPRRTAGKVATAPRRGRSPAVTVGKPRRPRALAPSGPVAHRRSAHQETSVANSDERQIITDGIPDQYPDADETETREWLESFDAVVEEHGPTRGRFLLLKVLQRAREQNIGLPSLTTTDYINTIPPEREPDFPGDETLEKKIRRHIRWNAAVMVHRTNVKRGTGGHIGTYASAASLYEVGYNHFFRGHDAPGGADQVFFQGHASPGIYARSYLIGRITEEQLDLFRSEVEPGGLSSYPHPRLMPEFWEFPSVSMGLGPLNAIYQARFNRYLQNRGFKDTSQQRVWFFGGDGETAEPETLGALSVASREGLDNLTFVINCNLQQLDGPVRGNGKIIQELEGVFRGAGWNVIKVIWGRQWDELLALDVDGALVKRMNEVPDGQMQTYTAKGVEFVREDFFNADPQLKAIADRYTDDQLSRLTRGGHDYRKVYAAYKAATETTGAPTVILAQTVKGWTLGPDFEA